MIESRRWFQHPCSLPTFPDCREMDDATRLRISLNPIYITTELSHADHSVAVDVQMLMQRVKWTS